MYRNPLSLNYVFISAITKVWLIIDLIMLKNKIYERQKKEWKGINSKFKEIHEKNT